MTPRRFALRLTGGRSFLFHRYAADAACPTDCSKQFPGLPSNACSDPSFMPDPLPAHDYHDFAIEDTLRVPSDLPPGDYVVKARLEKRGAQTAYHRAGARDGSAGLELTQPLTLT